jgi:hypothetical protein
VLLELETALQGLVSGKVSAALPERPGCAGWTDSGKTGRRGMGETMKRSSHNDAAMSGAEMRRGAFILQTMEALHVWHSEEAEPR